MKWRVLASACAAAVAVTSMPYMATQVHAEPAAVTQQTGNNDLKLWYTSPADITRYYEGWQEKSLPMVMEESVDPYSVGLPENASS